MTARGDCPPWKQYDSDILIMRPDCVNPCVFLFHFLLCIFVVSCPEYYTVDAISR